MGAGPTAKRVIVLGVGLGLSLLLLEAAAPHGLPGGATALVSLVPAALAFALGGLPAVGLTTAVAVGGAIAVLDRSAALVVLLKDTLPGLVLGLALSRRLALPTSLMLVAATSGLGLAVTLSALVPAGTTPLALVERQLEAHVPDVGELPAWLGLNGEPGWAAESTQMVASALRVAGPGMILVVLFAGALVNYLAARLCLRGRGFRPFAEEAVPDHLVWGVIGAGALVVSRQSALEIVGLNLLIALVPPYAIQGLAVLRHFFLRVRVPRALQAVSFGLLAVQPLLLIAVACVGLSDLWIDFRNIRRAPTIA
jgi:uncharacterized protein YybS (DUF2232 family)